jgi:magnesium-transporting ATPase (P-type)
VKNYRGKTPKDLFTKTHEKLHKDGEKWMRGTAMHCMLVATLIATVVFAAIFTVPGGNQQEEGKHQEEGTPILLKHNWFLVFFISDSIALLSSSTSILIFLSILTSRYTERDFVSSLPRRLMFGLTALFISIVGMVVAFGATCFLVYQRKKTKVPTVIITLAGVPICSYILLHYELWVDIISSTYLSRFLFRSRNRMFC